MTTVNATEARAQLYTLIDETTASHQPIVIKGKRSNTILLSEEDWNTINETLYLVSIPGMRESIMKGKLWLRSAARSLTGNVAIGLYQTGAKRCPKAGEFWPQRQGSKTV